MFYFVEINVYHIKRGGTLIKKYRDIPYRVLKLEALLRRLLQDHAIREQIEADLGARQAGIRGEKALDYYIAQITEKGHFIFQNLRLPLPNGSFFQIDILFLSQRQFIIFEAKNISGDIYIDPNQMERTLGETKNSYSNPIDQVANQQYHLQNLIESHMNIKLPAYSFVVFTNQNSTIIPNPQYRAIAEKVIRPLVIRQRVAILSERNRRDIMEKKQLNKLARILLKLHTPDDPNILDKFLINKEELITGIQCENCKNFTVQKYGHAWLCTNCNGISKTAHLRALLDYCLLIGSTISRKQCSEFLHLTPSVSSKLLRSLKLPTSGKLKTQTYELSISDLQKRIEETK
ncbi:nuclease-related domain-containing protein [Bacillus sp. FJAT-50079]|uniref:nuclease-related domain-containing protein n=1 Tax=Bacillus sp. FJAT-50079 TaxID=2833577 RepID=UPI001BC9D6DB|nr:nuclease-related domain-containing protein [Bacillus sp. FJAT-50079]MBS4209570.1 NERD domain-containing protein [Bacillus sp. FJAT-50079]